MKCEEAGEFVSALHDGERIPREAAEHLSACEVCRMRLSAYSGIGTELRRVASLEESGDVKEGLWAKEQRIPSNWWQKGKETMRIPRFAFALMLAVIFLLSGSLFLVRARPGATGSVLWLTSKLPPKGEILHCAIATVGEPGSDGCGRFGNVPNAGMLSVNIRFIRREGERVELGVKTRYENPPPVFTGDAEERLKDTAEERIWIGVGGKQEISVAGLGPIEMIGAFMDHKPPPFFTPDDTVDPRANEFRIVSPVLIRGKELVFNFSGASSSGSEARDSAVMIYWPGEGRYIISSVPINGAVEAQVDVSQIRFNLEGQDYVLLTAVPVTRAEHAWIKHQRNYKPPGYVPDGTDEGMLGSVSLSELRKE